MRWSPSADELCFRDGPTIRLGNFLCRWSTKIFKTTIGPKRLKQPSSTRVRRKEQSPQQYWTKYETGRGKNTRNYRSSVGGPARIARRYGEGKIEDIAIPFEIGLIASRHNVIESRLRAAFNAEVKKLKAKGSTQNGSKDTSDVDKDQKFAPAENPRSLAYILDITVKAVRRQVWCSGS
jgi:hypothetical protein